MPLPRCSLFPAGNTGRCLSTPALQCHPSHLPLPSQALQAIAACHCSLSRCSIQSTASLLSLNSPCCLQLLLPSRLPSGAFPSLAAQLCRSNRRILESVSIILSFHTSLPSPTPALLSCLCGHT